MNLAILHYHLDHGGVTQAIVNQLRSLDSVLKTTDGVRVALLYGSRCCSSVPVRVERLNNLKASFIKIPSLEYDDGHPVDLDLLTQQIELSLHRRGFNRENSIVHVHNHSLGKNVALPEVLSRMNHKGWKMLLQMHDFAEDFRPINYKRLLSYYGTIKRLTSTLYPQSETIHFAVVNRRDEHILRRAGLRASNIHYMPNPVPEFADLPQQRAARKRLARKFGVPIHHRYILYPTRGIRRKNIGEVLLISLMGGADTTFGMTLAPSTPVDVKLYQAWKSFAKDLCIGCVFETGMAGGLSFVENLSASDLILTTSLAEGFGMAFAEPWLAGRMLVGRDLPEITSDFTSAGMKLNHLHTSLYVPQSRSDRDEFRKFMEVAYLDILKQYRRAPKSGGILSDQIARMSTNDKIDFGRLNATFQRRVIRSLVENKIRINVLDEFNPQVRSIIDNGGDGATSLIRHNAKIVGTAFSLSAMGQALYSLYMQILSSTPADSAVEPLDGSVILDGFLDIKRFYPAFSEQ
jgi:hypothetical protein